MVKLPDSSIRGRSFRCSGSMRSMRLGRGKGMIVFMALPHPKHCRPRPRKSRGLLICAAWFPGSCRAAGTGPAPHRHGLGSGGYRCRVHRTTRQRPLFPARNVGRGYDSPYRLLVLCSTGHGFAWAIALNIW